jgi:hypothetical protein
MKASDNKFFNFRKIAENIDVSALIKKLDEHPELWHENTLRQNYPGSAHKDTECILVRWTKEVTLDAAFNDLKVVHMPGMEIFHHSMDEIATQIIKPLGDLKTGRVIMAKLKPDGLISPHIDEGPYADAFERFHICLKSEPGNQFYVETSPGCGEFVYMKPGELWWFNHKAMHTVYNGSETDRIHLIIDAKAPKFRMDRDT